MSPCGCTVSARWVTITDPAAIENARRIHPQLSYVEDRDEALRGADAVIVVTEWDEYRRELSPEHAGDLVTGRDRRRRPQLPRRRRLAGGGLDLLRHGTAVALVATGSFASMPHAGSVAGRFNIPSLNGIRALAILLVVWGHAELPYRLIRESTGVTIFFFLSGYLITTLLRREYDAWDRISIKDFYLRRVFRIFPPLYVVLIIAVALSLTGIIANEMTAMGRFRVLLLLGELLHHLGGSRRAPRGYERAVVAGGRGALLPDLPDHLCVPPTLGASSVGPGGDPGGALPRDHGLAHLPVLAGRRLRSHLPRHRHPGRRDPLGLGPRDRGQPGVRRGASATRPWVLTPILLGGAGVVYLVSRWPNQTGMTFGYTIQSIALAAVFIPVILAPRSIVGRVLNFKAVAWVGIISYSIYLIHRPALELVEEYLSTPQVVTATIGIAVTVLASWAMMVWVERPFGRLRRRANRAGEIENNRSD